MDATEIRFVGEHCKELAGLIAGWKRPLLFSHARADGDAIGSLCAMRSILRGLGNEPTPLLFEPPQVRYQWLLDEDPIAIFAGTDDPALSEADGVIVLDTCSDAQLEPVAAWLRSTSLPKLAVDHHVTRDPLVDHYLVDEHASATCLMVYEWAQHANWPLDDQARLALYVGMTTDTGWFRFSNTDARTMEAAGALVRDGVQPAAVFERLFQAESSARFRLLGAVLSAAELFCDERFAILALTQEMFSETGATASDTEDLVNYPLQIATVDASCLLIDQANGTIRASFRSKAPHGSRPDVDVSLVAAGLGGGGHRRAAAARIPGSIDEVKKIVLGRLSAAISEAQTQSP